MTASQRWSGAEWQDAVLAVGLALIGLRGTWIAAANQGLPPPDLPAYLLVLTACLPVAVVRRWPLAAMAGSGVASVAYVAAGYALGPILLTDMVTVYVVASRRPVRQSVVGAALLLVAVLAALAARIFAAQWEPSVVGAAVVGGLVWVGGPALLGGAVRVRRESAAGVRLEQARRQASEERLQVAQDVHDGLGHGLAVIAMQAGVGLHLLDRDPGKARAALESVRTTSKAALDQLRVELDALRGAPDAPRRPWSGLEDLPELVERIDSAGVDVVLRVGPGGGALPAEAQTAAYRIVQEALTNVLRHAGHGATATVDVRCVRGALLVEVTDTGAGCAGAPAAGHGLRGMKARAAALGGDLEAGPGPGGGFEVRARLPLPGAAP